VSKKPSRISLFWTELGGGGVERVMLTLAEIFLERGIETDIVLLRAEGDLAGEIPSGARVFDLGAQRLIACIPGLVRYLRQHRPPVLLSAQKTVNCAALLARALSMAPTRVVISVHSTLSTLVNLSDWRDRVAVHLVRFMYPYADRTITVSKEAAEDLSHFIGLNRGEIDVIYNPVIGPNVKGKVEKSVDHPWFSDESIPVILGVGRLLEQKDFPTLIQAFAKLRTSRSSRLAILGEGDRRPFLEDCVERLGLSEHVWMPGFKPNPLKYMANADVFVLSSKREGLGNVLIEAMACGTPVVSTDCKSGPSEILKGGEYGRLVPVGDSSALAAAIEEALDGHVSPAPRSALDRFRRDKVAEQYLDTLSNAAQGCREH
jgi:glycosyltransferase involved in cell wall biosynthesis